MVRIQDRRIVLLTSSIPHCKHGGGGITAYSIGKALIEAGFHLSVLALARSAVRHANSSGDEACVAEWKASGADCHILDCEISYRPPKGLAGRLADENFFPAVRARPFAIDYLERIQPDALVHYHWEALAATWGWRGCPKVGLVGDPVHLPALFRRAFQQTSRSAGVAAMVRKYVHRYIYEARQLRGMVRMMNECEVAGAFAAHHSHLLRKAGAVRCRYFRTPVPDPGVRLERRSNLRLRIVHIGHLQGIATLTGVRLLVDEVVPMLERSLTIEGFELHIVGGSIEAVPADLRAKLNHPAIKLRGQVTPADDEFRAAHVVVVPTPIELGIRVRVITGFSMGSAMAVHVANRAGIPELSDGKNCLLGSSGKDLAEACLRLWREPALRAALETGARETYERHFSPRAAGTVVAAAVGSVVKSSGRGGI